MNNINNHDHTDSPNKPDTEDDDEDDVLRNKERMERSIDQLNSEMQDSSADRCHNISRKFDSSETSFTDKPPRPFKKARYAWEIKNYEYTVKSMTENTGECSDSKHDSSPEHSPAANLASDGVLPSLEMTQQYNRKCHQDIPFFNFNMPEYYTGTPLNACSQQAENNEYHRHFMGQAESHLFRWHTRQLCCSIVDNTINKMLEQMGFSPITEQNQNFQQHLMFNLSDDEEVEEDSVQKQIFENEALNAALYNKGLWLPPYQYDPLESSTTTDDYDSSEEDSEFGDPALSVSPCHSPVVNSSQVVPEVELPMLQHQQQNIQLQVPQVCDKIMYSPKPVQVCHSEECCKKSAARVTTSDVRCKQDSPEKYSNDSVNLSWKTQDLLSLPDDGRGQENSAQVNIAIKSDKPDALQLSVMGDPKSEDNNNDTFFIDQAIQMAINKQGLGFQKA